MKYVLGVDFGTLSARAVLLRVSDGAQVATAASGYGAYDVTLPGGLTLRPRSCCAVPAEYRRALEEAVKETLRLANVAKEDVCGVAVDSTSMTVVPLTEDGAPVCEKPGFERVQDAYIKVWKSHSAEEEAQRIEAVAKETGEPFLRVCGHRVSSEWLYPKALETLHHAPAVYAAARYLLDCADWVNYLLTGKIARSVNSLGIKTFRRHDTGLPSAEFWRKVDENFADVNGKLDGRIALWGEKIGELTEEAARWLGLCPGIAVASGSLDGHSPLAALGMNRDGDLLLSIGTSNVQALLSDTYSEMPGICSMGVDTMVPGFSCYDAGQAACGDMLAWYMDNMLPEKEAREAREKGVSPHTLLSERAFAVPPDAQGLVVLDWFNGNRCPYARADLKARMDGLTLWTRPEHIYRAMVEATGFGSREIIENMEANGCAVRRIVACGGIAVKNPQLVQCYADIFGREIYVSALQNAAANGAGVLAATAAGAYPTLAQAMDAMSTKEFRAYTPNPDNKPAYDALFARYQRLCRETMEDAE